MGYHSGGTWVAVGLGLALLSGCHVETNKNGDKKDVNISTPFGGMQVKTNDAAGVEKIGLPGYPGAQPAKKDNGDSDNDSANVNMSFGSFQLKVNAASFQTGDAPDKVEAFYRNGMKRYGDVIACRNNAPVGLPTHTADGLTCDTQKSGHIKVETDSGRHKLELMAGSKQHQHVVTIDTEGSGTKFEMVALDLPGKMFADDKGDEDRQ